MPTRPAPYASYPVLVHRLTPLLQASFRPHLTTSPLRFAMTSPPSGCQRNFHPQAVEHARHTRKKGPPFGGLFLSIPCRSSFKNDEGCAMVPWDDVASITSAMDRILASRRRSSPLSARFRKALNSAFFPSGAMGFGLPRISCSDQPNKRSAAGFQTRI